MQLLHLTNRKPPSRRQGLLRLVMHSQPTLASPLRWLAELVEVVVVVVVEVMKVVVMVVVPALGLASALLEMWSYTYHPLWQPRWLPTAAASWMTLKVHERPVARQ